MIFLLALSFEFTFPETKMDRRKIINMMVGLEEEFPLNYGLVGGFKYFLFSPLLGGNDPIWLFFSNVLKPPTSGDCWFAEPMAKICSQGGPCRRWSMTQTRARDFTLRELSQRVLKFANPEPSPLDSTPTKGFSKWWFQILSFFQPDPEKPWGRWTDAPNLTSFFQKRWFNHRPEKIRFFFYRRLPSEFPMGFFSAQVTTAYGSLSSNWYGPTFCTSGRRTIFREFCSRLGAFWVWKTGRFWVFVCFVSLI